MNSPRRILFQVRNRRGLGHLMRGLNVARELRTIAPETEILFYLRTPPAEGFWPEGLRWFAEPDPDALAHWPEVAAGFEPDVVVYDTMLPKAGEPEALSGNSRRVYIMRKCLAAEQQEVFAHPLLERMAAIIVPHSPEEFGYPLPPALAAKTRFVGPIVRRPEAAAINALRTRYGVDEHDFLLVSTVGGGGFGPQADTFFAAVFAAHRTLAAVIPHLRHVVVEGPNYAGTLTPPAGVTLVDVEPDMVNLLAACNLAIAEGGYNTVNEIRVSRTPAVFMPSERGKDDQEARVRELAARGFGRVVVPADGSTLAACVLDLVHTPGALAAIRARYAGDAVRTGNRAAAECIRELLS